MPFRSAHEISGKVVHLSETKNCELDEICLEDLVQIRYHRFCYNKVQVVIHKTNSETIFKL